MFQIHVGFRRCREFSPVVVHRYGGKSNALLQMLQNLQVPTQMLRRIAVWRRGTEEGRYWSTRTLEWHRICAAWGRLDRCGCKSYTKRDGENKEICELSLVEIINLHSFSEPAKWNCARICCTAPTLRPRAVVLPSTPATSCPAEASAAHKCNAHEHKWIDGQILL